jgi:4-carboxymuconolactone decarboxylase
MSDTEDRYERGFLRYAELGGTGTRGHVYDDLAEICPDLPRFVIEFGYGDIHSRPGLDAARRELVILGSLITLGGVEAQLEVHVGSALNAGLEPAEIVEAILQVLPYAGFPRVVAAMNIAKRVFGSRNLLPLSRSL